MLLLFSRRHVIGLNVEDEDKKHTWMEDADVVSRGGGGVEVGREYLF